MGNIVIKTIVKKGGDERTLAGSLAKNGYARQPGCGVTLTAFREVDGRYRTGMDEDAIYIKSLSTEEAEIEKARCRKLRERLEKLTGLDLGPFSDYYSKTYDDGNGQFLRALSVKLSDKETVFNTDDPISEITAAWVSVHPIVAPSYESYRKGDANPNVGWYVSNDEVENQIKYNEKREINKARGIIDGMAPTNRKRLARLLELPVSSESKEEYVYNLLDNLLDKGTIDFGSYRGQRAVRVVNELLDMAEETLNLKDLVKQAIQQGIYRRNKSGLIMQGETVIADSEATLIAQLATSIEDRASLEKKVKSKQKIA